MNGLVERFVEAQKMMRQLASGGGMPGLPGIPGMGRGGKKSKGKQAPQRKVKGKSGNPAVRAQQEAAARGKPDAVAAPGSAFGLGAPPAAEQFDATAVNADLGKYLRR